MSTSPAAPSNLWPGTLCSAAFAPAGGFVVTTTTGEAVFSALPAGQVGTCSFTMAASTTPWAYPLVAGSGKGVPGPAPFVVVPGVFVPNVTITGLWVTGATSMYQCCAPQTQPSAGYTPSAGWRLCNIPALNTSSATGY